MKYLTNLVAVLLLVTGFLFSLCLYLSYRSIKTMESINNRVDRANVEYQFVITDSLITVYDANRVVGTVKIEGQLDSLITADNE